jgi:hypothetical protein
LRPLVGGQEQPACTLVTRPLPDPIPGRAAQVRAASRRAYGRTAGQRDRATLRRDLGHDDPRLPRPAPPPGSRRHSRSSPHP